MVADPNFYKAVFAIAVRMENRISSETARGLEALGHSIELIDGWALGSMQGILKDLATDVWLAGADPRRVAYAVGY